jgi:hypothetical protein
MAAGGSPAAAQDAAASPEYQVDPFWPKPLPNDWILGQVAGVTVGSRDHVWIIQRPGSLSEREVGASLDPPISNCCVAAPPVLVFDAAGNLLRHRNGPGEGYDWPENETGAYKRHWGAYGNEPSDEDLGAYDPDKPPAEQFRNPVHCVNFTDDGRLYVCDRVNDRYQVFEKDGTFVEEHFFEPQTLLNGSVSDLTFSNDADQTYIFMVDGVNNEARVVERASGDVLSTFGRPGRYAGQFHVVHDVAIDSKDNLYTTEVNTGQRAQKFVPVED